MPELPEVETVVREIRPVIKGRILVSPPLGKIKDVTRRGKNIIISLEDKYILIHLKMTGRVLWNRDKYVRWSFKLDNGREFFLSDPRKFASLNVVDNLDRLKKLGPEATDGFDVRQYRGKIKTVLMNQEIVAGIGNIYSDEILWRARVHPLRSASSLSASEMKKISGWAQKILAQGVLLKGDSTKDFFHPDGSRGKFQYEHRVYGRVGLLCLRNDGGVINKIKIGGRSASFCPICQL